MRDSTPTKSERELWDKIVALGCIACAKEGIFNQHEMNLTAKSAADILGVSRMSYSNWTNGRHPIPVSVDYACAAILNELLPYSERENND